MDYLGTLTITDNITEAIMVQVTLNTMVTLEDAEAEFHDKYPKDKYTWELTTHTGTKTVLNDVPVVESEMTDEERNAAIEANLSDVKELPSLAEIDLDAVLPVAEVFDSVQGEGAFIGMPTTFIRLCGCDMACPWCDSKETWKKPTVEDDEISLRVVLHEAGYTKEEIEGHMQLNGAWAEQALSRRWLTIRELVDEVHKGVVVITGGEPCIHEKLQDLVLAIKYIKGKDKVLVCIETNGAQATPDGIDWVVASPKPNNGYKLHPECQWNELKYVVDDNFEPEVVPESVLNGTIPAGVVWLQPCDIRFGMAKNEKVMLTDVDGCPVTDENGVVICKDKNELTILEATERSWRKCYDLAMQYDCFRVGIQLHKFMGAR